MIQLACVQSGPYYDFELLLVLFLAACLAVALIAISLRHKMKDKYGVRIAATASIAALIAIIWSVTVCCFSCNDGSYVSREPLYLESQLIILGQHVAATVPDAKILLITDAVTEHNRDRHQDMRNAIEKGLDGKATIIAVYTPPPPVGSDEEMMMYEYYLTPEAFDEAIDMHPECDVVISWMGLPKDFTDMTYWSSDADSRPKLFLVNANPYGLKEKISDGSVAALIAHRPDIKYDINDVAPEGLQERFDKRYLLIHADNVEDVATRFPKMFKPSKADPPKK